MAQTLADVCEPFFRFVCNLNRQGRELAALNQQDKIQAAQVRIEAFRRVDLCRQEAETLRMSDDFKAVEPDLFALLDDVIRCGKFGFSAEWNPISIERFNDVAWRTTFYTDRLLPLLEQSSANPSTAARLGVVYRCLGLGFMGQYEQSPGQIGQLLGRIVDKLDPAGSTRREVDPIFDAQMCRDNYSTVDPKLYWTPIGEPLKWAGLTAALLVVVLVIAVPVACSMAMSTLTNNLTKINDDWATWNKNSTQEFEKALNAKPAN
jgi:type VI protein secretion system component VasF